MQDLTVTLIQTELFWEDIPANLAMFDEKINGVSDKTDVIVLPEMFATGFTVNVENMAQTMTGAVVSWMAAKARQRQSHIAGSVIIEENKRYFNRLVWTKPDGEMLTYDKKHLFRMAGEHKIFTPGNSHLTVAVNGWKLRPFLCYDLRFPVWCRNIDNAYDAAIFIANWPARRAHHWNILLPARAVENQSYVIGVNRLGEDGNGVAHSGDSCVIAPTGEVLFRQTETSCVHTARLHHERVKEFRETFSAWQDADRDMLKYGS